MSAASPRRPFWSHPRITNVPRINFESRHQVEGLSIDIPVMMSRKEKIVANFTGGVAMLLKKNKVTSMHGRGTLLKRDQENRANALWQIEVKNGDSVRTIEAKHVIIATGSTPRTLALAPVDNERILDNTGALSLTEAPRRLAVIGGGVIGLEMGSYGGGSVRRSPSSKHCPDSLPRPMSK